MSSIISWIKNVFSKFVGALPEILKGFVIFALSFSGFGCALLLRYLSFDGYIITALSLFVEGLALILCYVLFRSYFKTEPETTPISGKKK